ncbi:MAG: hypothetical protein Fur002_22750 [Anaerolineales bacterium]
MKAAVKTAFILCLLLLAAFTAPRSARAANFALSLPTLNEFVRQVFNGEPDALRGIYIPNTLALRIEQQPANDPKFISSERLTATEFSMAARLGNVGLLAHNNLAGKLFFDIRPRAEITLVYGGGGTETFVVNAINAYQALAGGNYLNLTSGEVVSSRALFEQMYEGERRLTLQTCIEYNGDKNWGRLFILAAPRRADENNAERPNPRIGSTYRAFDRFQNRNERAAY